ncbi:Sal-like protein 3 [Saguinus oedipus]|uniref:Sal-like protein 3 n=1 Tax=Saguinus oedipus TaxID=9490 RepID=A0ABQ9ULM3_SAGOE|nr:Sal-like protein 3 [Saguinus oedipus]
MDGQIPNTLLPEDFQDTMDSELAYNDKNTETLSSFDDCMNENSMEDDVELKDVAGDPSKPLLSYTGCPQLTGLKSVENRSGDSDRLSNDSSSAVGDLESHSVGSSALSSSSSSSSQALSLAPSNGESFRSKSPGPGTQEEPQEIALKT